MSNSGAAGGLLLSSSAEVRAALLGESVCCWALTPADHLGLERLTRLRALLFDSNEGALAAELYTEDAVHLPMIGREAIAKGYASQSRARTAGKFRLRSRHHVSNLVVKPCAEEATVTGVYYLINFRNPDSEYVTNDGPPEPLHGPAFVGEYRFEARRCADGGWRFSNFEEQQHFGRVSVPVDGRNQGPSSSIPDSELAKL